MENPNTLTILQDFVSGNPKTPHASQTVIQSLSKSSTHPLSASLNLNPATSTTLKDSMNVRNKGKQSQRVDIA